MGRPLNNKAEPTKERMCLMCETRKGLRVGMRVVSSQNSNKACVAKAWAIREKLAGDEVGWGVRSRLYDPFKQGSNMI